MMKETLLDIGNSVLVIGCSQLFFKVQPIYRAVEETVELNIEYRTRNVQ